jgi:putative hydrolase of the HAD superfamily
MSDPRAIVFDLDDTLYPAQTFLSSGFAAVADAAAPELGVSAADVFTLLFDARRFTPGRELQFLCDWFGLSPSCVGRWVQIIRGHEPDIRLPLESARVLIGLRETWRVGVLTNGRPDIQRRKVAALGVDDFVDAVVFATECGDGAGKPDRAGFDAVLAALGVPASRAVFVGDDLDADIAGASRAGLRTIHVAPGSRPARTRHRIRPDARVARMADVPRAAERLIEGAQRVNVA